MKTILLSLTIVAQAATMGITSELSQKRYENWHQWRGPDANGVAPLATPPLRWDEQANIKWKVPIPGSGHSTPIVWEDRIFLISAIDTKQKAEPAADSASDSTEQPNSDTSEQQPSGRRRGGRGQGGFGGRFGGAAPTTLYQFVVICLDRQTGRTLWQRTAREEVPHAGKHSTNSYASASPSTDGENLYLSFGSHGVYSYDFDGNLRWKVDFGKMRKTFGEGTSPTLFGDTLIVNWDHQGPSFIAALDTQTGQTKWKVDRDEGGTWGTPLVVQRDGGTQVVVTGSNRMRGYDLETGEELWQCSGLGSNPIPTPVALGNRVYCMSGHRSPALYAVDLDASGDVTGTDNVAWHLDGASTPYVSSPLLVDGLLYITKNRQNIISCLDAETGETVFDEQRLPGLGTIYASPVAAAGRIYYLDQRNGTSVVIKQGRQLEVLAANKLDEGFSASPAVVGHEMFLRGDEHLYCIAE